MTNLNVSFICQEQLEVLIKKAVDEALKNQSKSNKVYRDYQKDILKFLIPGAMTLVDLRKAMKTSENLLYQALDQLQASGKIIKLKNNHKVSFKLKYEIT